MTKTALLNFQYIFVDAGVKPTIFLLHGTGGDEYDLLPLVQPLQNQYNLVGLKGNVSEQGMARFFARTAMGVFDQENLQQEVNKLAQFLTAWYADHALTSQEATFIGYSNGANMILATLFLYPDLVDRAVLLHPMLPFIPRTLSLTGKQFLVSYGENDQLISSIESQKVLTVLQTAGAMVITVSHPGGHDLDQVEVAALRQFLV